MELAKKEDFSAIFSLMKRSFPLEEFREMAAQERLLQHPAYRIYVVRDGAQKIKSFLAAWEFDTFRFVEHLAVDPSIRGGGLGGKMIEEYLERDKRPVFLEVEPPKTEIARRRIGFYQRHGIRLNQFAYWQQPLREGDVPMPLLVMSWPEPVSAQEFEPFKKIIYREVYGVTEDRG